MYCNVKVLNCHAVLFELDAYLSILTLMGDAATHFCACFKK